MRVYGGGAYRAAFLLCFAIAALAFVAACAVAETRGRDIWRGFSAA